jgi:hypothetical protein
MQPPEILSIPDARIRPALLLQLMGWSRARCTGALIRGRIRSRYGTGRGVFTGRPGCPPNEATILRVPRYEFTLLAEGEGMHQFRDVLHYLETLGNGCLR